MRGRAAVLVDDDVRVLLRDEHVTRTRVELERDLIRHRRGRDEDRRLVSEERRHAILQRVDRRILALLLVADDASAMARRMPVRRLRRRVRAQVDHGRDATVRRMDLALLERTLDRAGRACLPRTPGVGVDGSGRRVVRRHDDAAEGAARDARRIGAVLDARGRRPSASRRTARPRRSFARPTAIRSRPCSCATATDAARCVSRRSPAARSRARSARRVRCGSGET